VRVHALDVDSRQRSLELTGHLERDRDATAGDTDDDRLVELEGSDGRGQGAPGGGAISKEGRDPRNEAHASIVPGPEPRTRLSPCPRTCAGRAEGGFAAGVGKEYVERRNDRR